MGAAYFVVLEPGGPLLDTSMDGKMLSRAIQALDKVAASLRVKPLSAFVSFDPEAVAEFLEENAPVPSAEWFPADEGLATVQALHTHLTAHNDAVPGSNDVLEDLNAMGEILTAASENGIRWHLEADF